MFQVTNCDQLTKPRTVRPNLHTDEPVCPDGQLQCGDGECIEKILFCDDKPGTLKKRLKKDWLRNIHEWRRAKIARGISDFETLLHETLGMEAWERREGVQKSQNLLNINFWAIPEKQSFINYLTKKHYFTYQMLKNSTFLSNTGVLEHILAI